MLICSLTVLFYLFIFFNLFSFSHFFLVLVDVLHVLLGVCQFVLLQYFLTLFLFYSCFKIILIYKFWPNMDQRHTGRPVRFGPYSAFGPYARLRRFAPPPRTTPTNQPTTIKSGDFTPFLCHWSFRING